MFGIVFRFLFGQILESKTRRLGLLKHGSRMEGFTKVLFSQKSFLRIPESVFWCFSEALGEVFLVVVALETGLEIDGFSRWGPDPIFWGRRGK